MSGGAVGSISGQCAICADDSSTVQIAGGEITADGSAGIRFSGAQMAITGGVIGGTVYDLAFMGETVVVDGTSLTTISGGTLISDTAGILFSEEQAVVDIEGGDFRTRILRFSPGPANGIQASGASTINISGGTFVREPKPPDLILFDVPTTFGIVAEEMATVNVFGSGLSIVDGNLTGTLVSGDPIDVVVEGNVLLHEVDTRLQAGDADQDWDFDQFDLIQVQAANKYRKDSPATWGQGDWNGAPGGAVGNPPIGDGRFDQQDIVAALKNGLYRTGPYIAVPGGGQRNDDQTSIFYDARTGEVSVDAPAGVQLTSINIDSAGGIFTGESAQNLGGSFDNDADHNIFKATFGSSFGSLSFGPVAQVGLSANFVSNDLTVVGSLAGGGDLGDVDLVYVPEPSTVTLVLFSLAALVGWRGRTRIVDVCKDSGL
jgi:hypothetical protein